MTLNEPLAVEAARALARLALADGGSTDPDRVTFAFRRCVGRAPTDAEREVLLKLLDDQRRRIADGWVNPWEVVTGDKVRPTRGPAPRGPARPSGPPTPSSPACS